MGGGPKPRKSGAQKGGAQKGWGPEGGAPKVGPRRVGGPKFRAFSSLSRHRFAVSVSLWGSFSWNFGGVLKRRDPEMCTFGVSRAVVCEPRRPGREDSTTKEEW